MFVTKKDQERATYHMLMRSGQFCGARDDRGRDVFALDGKAYAVNHIKRIAICMGDWFEFRARCFETGKRFNLAGFIHVVNGGK